MSSAESDAQTDPRSERNMAPPRSPPDAAGGACDRDERGHVGRCRLALGVPAPTGVVKLWPLAETVPVHVAEDYVVVEV